MSVPIVGILGGVGSGKTSVVRRVTDIRLQIVDADRIGHDLLLDPDVVCQLTQIFPATILDSSGQVVRSRLAQLVFGKDTEHKAALKQLEQILHPAIHREIKAQIQSVSASVDAIILDAAILLETGWADACNHLIFVDTPEPLRIQRVKQNRNWTAEEFRRREKSQMPVESKKQRANFVVDNSGTIQKAAQQLTDILMKLIDD